MNLTATESEILVRINQVTAADRWNSLTEVRKHLAGWTREEQDSTLRKMERMTDVNLVPESNQKTLTDRQREAAVVIGDQPKHLIWIAE